MRLLLISNSTNAGESYLEYPKNQIRDFLGRKPVKCVFIPYAAVTFSFDDYLARVSQRFNEIGHPIDSVHHYSDPSKAIEESEAIITGGGNTFHLIKHLQENNLIEIIREKVISGTPYVGWSAGANVACPAIYTTNDMPVIQPESFRAFNLIPFQINPHYTDLNPEGHAGETRQARIEEFIALHPNTYVAGLREGTMLLIENQNIRLIGKRNIRIFRYGMEAKEIEPDGDLSFLLSSG